MDKEGFNLIDQEFQKEVKAKQLEITEKWEKSYSHKHYIGTPEMQQKARETDNYQRMVGIKNEVNLYKEKLGERHFGEGGREAAAQKVREQEQKTSQELMAKQQKEERALEVEQKAEKIRQQTAKQREEFNRNANNGFKGPER